MPRCRNACHNSSYGAATLFALHSPFTFPRAPRLQYLNNMPAKTPPGFDAFMGNGGGDYTAPRFAVSGLADVGPWGIQDGSWKGTQHNYTTAVVGNVSIAWIEKTVAAQHPFFAYIAPKAAHEPFIPAPWHLDHWDDSWPATEPRGTVRPPCAPTSTATSRRTR